LIKAVQELSAQVNTLKEEIKELKDGWRRKKVE
jgi:cell division protein FtsB